MMKKLAYLVMIILFNSGCQSMAPLVPQVPPAILSLPENVHQVILVTSKGPGDFHAELSAWERTGNTWQKVFPEMKAVIGRAGLANIGEKKEGDGKTPQGVYPLRRAFGYLESVPTKLEYKMVTKEDIWVDDVSGPFYNQWVKAGVPAKSFEQLRRDDDLYKYAVVIEYNTEPIVPGAGSAIFLHIWRGTDFPTAGCVAVTEEGLLKLLGWLDILQRPVIILKPNFASDTKYR